MKAETAKEIFEEIEEIYDALEYLKIRLQQLAEKVAEHADE